MTEKRKRPVAAFRSEGQEAAFTAAYEAALTLWPLPVTSIDVPGNFGTTHLQRCGPEDGAPILLLHGGGCTSTVWWANVAGLGRTHCVYAVDQIGDTGLSIPSGRPVRSIGDLMGWLDGLIDGLGVDAAALCGHSYGGWLALNYALHAPERVTRMALLDPTTCFGGLSLRYRLRAIPLFARPSAERMRRFLEWETDGAALDPASLTLACMGVGEFQRSKVVMPRRPSDDRLRRSTVPTLLVLAEESKAHDARRIGEHAKQLISQLTTVVLPGATHHTIPTLNPDRLNRALAQFLV